MKHKKKEQNKTTMTMERLTFSSPTKVLVRSQQIKKFTRRISLPVHFNNKDLQKENSKRIYVDYIKPETQEYQNDGKPVGIIGLYDTSLSKEPNHSAKLNTIKLIIDNQTFFHSLEIFRSLFPPFPAKMLKALILRFSGNFKEIFLHLLDQGWSPLSSDSQELRELNNEAEIHFATCYFLGCDEEQIAQSSSLLLEHPLSYFTYYSIDKDEIKYHLKYSDCDGVTHKRRIEKPNINIDNFPKLINPLRRGQKLSSFLPMFHYIH